MPSSVVASFSYKKETTTLRVVFVSGLVYEYLNVPEDVYEKMKFAASKGTYLNTFIKGKFYFKKL